MPPAPPPVRTGAPVKRRPTPAEVKELESMLQMTQRILTVMSGDARRESPQCKMLEIRYNTLNAKLTQLKREMEPPAGAGPARPGMPARAPLPPRPGMAGAPGGLPARPAVPGGMAAGAYGQPRPVMAPRPAGAPMGVPLARPGGAAAAYGGGAPGPVPGMRPGGLAPGVRPVAAQPPAMLPPVSAPARAPGQSLPLPKFTATMGEYGRPGVVYNGPEVAGLQKLLAHLGYNLEQSGEFDQATTRAVQMFQRAQGLPVAPTVGVGMRKVLNEMVTG